MTPVSADSSRAPKARVTLLPDPDVGPLSAAGATRSVQEAELIAPVEIFEEMWRPEYLERLARSYWAYLGRISLGLIRVVYEPGARTVVLFSKRLPLLRFRRPEYVTGPGLGQVTWRIERGILVAPEGRGQGMLRIRVRAADRAPDSREVTVKVRTEVANFYPFLRGAGFLARIGVRVYSATQVRIHLRVTHGFLRSLARLELPPSEVGALRYEQVEEGGATS